MCTIQNFAIGINSKNMICYAVVISLITLYLFGFTSASMSISLSMETENIPMIPIQPPTTPVPLGPVLGKTFNVTSRLYDVTLLPVRHAQVRSILNCAHLFDLRNTAIDAFVYYTQSKRCWILVAQTYGLGDNSVPLVGQDVKIGILQNVSSFTSVMKVLLPHTSTSYISLPKEINIATLWPNPTILIKQ